MIRVAKLPVDPGPAAWNSILPAAALGPMLEGSTTADFVVIGAGFAGVSAAKRLRQLQPTARVAVLEAKRVAEGPAGRNSGFMIDLPHDLASEDYGGALDRDRADIAQNRAAIRFARDMVAEYGLGAEAFDPSGKVNAAASARGMAHNAHYAKHLANLGEAYEVLDAGAMRAMTGSAYYSGGLYTPGTVMLQPALYMRGIAEGLRRDGIDIYENSPVTALTREGQSWCAATPQGSVVTPRVILGVNGHANSFGFYKRKLLHIFTYASMTRRLSEDERKVLGGAVRWGVTPADPMGTTVRKISGTGGDRIVIRNRFTCDPSMEVDAKRIERVCRDHDAAFAARFPKLANTAMEYRWGGRLCLSWNNVPALGEVEDGIYSAVCQNGLGTVKGTLAGMVAAELASDTPSPLGDAIATLDAPRTLPPGPITKIGANAHIRWQEHLAGAEK